MYDRETMVERIQYYLEEYWFYMPRKDVEKIYKLTQRLTKIPKQKADAEDRQDEKESRLREKENRY